MSSKLKIWFSDFSWHRWDKDGVFNADFLDRFDLELSQQSPDILLYSVFGNDNEKFRDCVKVLYSAENMFNNGWQTTLDKAVSKHYAITLNNVSSKRHFRMPNYIRKHGYDAMNLLIDDHSQSEFILKKKKFCAFVYSTNTNERAAFFNRLNKVMGVDSFGTLLNNVGGRVPREYGKGIGSIVKEYKFAISFENAIANGYSTEKIFEPMSVGTIPVYFGDPQISLDYNLNSFLVVKGPQDYDRVINRMIELHKDNGKYMEMAVKPFFNGNIVPDHLKEHNFIEFFSNILHKEFGACLK